MTAETTAETTGPGREPTTEEVFALLRDWLDAYPETDPVVEVQIYREGMRAAPAPAPDADALYGKLVPARIQAYLTGGGLFNPELANHDAVRDLIVDARALIEQQARELAALIASLHTEQDRTHRYLDRAERAERERDAARKAIAAADADAARYRWLRPLYFAIDWEYETGEGTAAMLLFAWPLGQSVSGSMDATIDAARAAMGDGNG